MRFWKLNCHVTGLTVTLALFQLLPFIPFITIFAFLYFYSESLKVNSNITVEIDAKKVKSRGSCLPEKRYFSLFKDVLRALSKVYDTALCKKGVWQGCNVLTLKRHHESNTNILDTVFCFTCWLDNEFPHNQYSGKTKLISLYSKKRNLLNEVLIQMIMLLWKLFKKTEWKIPGQMEVEKFE